MSDYDDKESIKHVIKSNIALGDHVARFLKILK